MDNLDEVPCAHFLCWLVEMGGLVAKLRCTEGDRKYLAVGLPPDTFLQGCEPKSILPGGHSATIELFKALEWIEAKHRAAASTHVGRDTCVWVLI